jgi:predicted HAD superfamily hydrolase
MDSLTEQQKVDYREMSINQQKDWYISYLENNHIHKQLYTEDDVINFYMWARKKYGSVKPLEEGCIVNKTDYKGLLQIYLSDSDR